MTRDSRQQHRRETLRFIILPFLGAVGVVLAAVIVTMLLPRRLQVSIIADLLLSFLVLCPLVVCLFPLCILMIALAASVARGHDVAARPLRRVEDWSRLFAEKTAQVADTVNHLTVDWSTRFAFVDRLLSVFDPPASEDATEGEEDV
jgi:hypothetical protein